MCLVQTGRVTYCSGRLHRLHHALPVSFRSGLGDYPTFRTRVSWVWNSC